jgi:hypothetical protein
VSTVSGAARSTRQRLQPSASAPPVATVASTSVVPPADRARLTVTWYVVSLSHASSSM